MDIQKLKDRLRFAKLILGDVHSTLKDFIIINNNKLTVKDNNYMILNSIVLKFIEKLEDDYNG